MGSKRASRRDILRLGFAGGIGLSLYDMLRFDANGAVAAEPKADSIIYLFLQGGIAQQESWDPKPSAPVENRGMFGSIPTKIPGVRFNELMPRTAEIVDRLTVIRSMTHGENDHDRGVHIMFTGYDPSPVVSYPSFGSVVANQLGDRNEMPPFINVPGQIDQSSGPGFLPSRFNGFSLGSDPANKNFRVQDLSLPDGVSTERFARRKAMLADVTRQFKRKHSGDQMETRDAFYRRAYELIHSKRAKEAFDLSREKETTRDSYGRSEVGARLLLARRLVEAGVRFITVQYGEWDHHAKLEPGIKKHVPPFDQAFAALIKDLEDRGMLDRTLVVASTEFGRTPTINTLAGRDHWGKVFSIAMAGGGMQRGLIYGASDAIAAEVAEDGLSIPDWASTMYHLLGINGHDTLMAPGNRPIEIARGGKVRRTLLL
ncbi:MAG: sulfatase [Planctomycetaceae bacterium]|nr:sulfatase [Planctomycetaceae bacterium]|tara:strand:+ start:6249 stop:7535 length:1287 start_codon:yes stop_codon:yes gene_type:complete